jgi:RNA polymerase sigma factor (sigma-70 family)
VRLALRDARLIADGKADGKHYSEDLISDAYLAVARGADTPHKIRNAVRSTLRKEWCRENRHVSLELADSLMRNGAPERARLDIRRAIDALDERQRAVVVLMFWDDLTQEEIAEELGVKQPKLCRVLAGAISRHTKPAADLVRI